MNVNHRAERGNVAKIKKVTVRLFLEMQEEKNHSQKLTKTLLLLLLLLLLQGHFFRERHVVFINF